MPVSIATGAPTLFIRRSAYEASGLTRSAIDERLGLTDSEFVVEDDLVALGPIYEAEGATLIDFITELERAGLVYFDDCWQVCGGRSRWFRRTSCCSTIPSQRTLLTADSGVLRKRVCEKWQRQRSCCR